jgi:hypothetical protein
MSNDEPMAARRRVVLKLLSLGGIAAVSAYLLREYAPWAAPRRIAAFGTQTASFPSEWFSDAGWTSPGPRFLARLVRAEQRPGPRRRALCARRGLRRTATIHDHVDHVRFRPVTVYVGHALGLMHRRRSTVCEARSGLPCAGDVRKKENRSQIILSARTINRSGAAPTKKNG